MTFENFVLCKNSGVQDIRLDGVRLATDPRSEPSRVVPMLRTFTLDEVRSASPEHRRDYAPYIGALSGKPPFDQRYAASFGGAGEYTASIEGTEIGSSCAQTGAAEGALNMGAVPETTFTELVFVVTTDRDGGTIKRAWLDYTADGEPRTLLIDWQMTACGRAVKRLCHS